MPIIKAIETYYKGNKFRSRLEARVAVIFDLLKIKYEYEKEGYKFYVEDQNTGVSFPNRYLPDFYLPDFNYYVEVKGKNDHMEDDLEKIRQFVMAKKTAIMIISNIPYDPEAKGLFWFPVMYYTARSRGFVNYCYAFFQSYEDGDIIIQDDFATGTRKHWRWEKPEWNKADRNSFAYNAIQPISGADLDDEWPIKDCWDLKPIEKAFLKASQARFEHGENNYITGGFINETY